MICPFCKKVEYEYSYVGAGYQVRSTTETFCECKEYDCPAYDGKSYIPICKLVEKGVKVI